MKSSKIALLTLLTIFAVASLASQGCKKSSIDTKLTGVAASNCPNAGAYVKKVANTKGIVWYSKEKKMYYIAVSTANLDKQDVGFVCNIPENFKRENLRVTFNGKYFQYNEEIAKFVATDYYYLTLEKITATSIK